MIEKHASQKTRIDWKALRAQAATGQIPAPPHASYMQQCHVGMLRYLERAARAGKAETINNFSVRKSNTAMGIVAKYRDVCLVALDVLRKP